MIFTVWKMEEFDDDDVLRMIEVLNEEAEEWRSEEGFHSGDRGYQDVLEDLNRFEEEAERRGLSI